MKHRPILINARFLKPHRFGLLTVRVHSIILLSVAIQQTAFLPKKKVLPFCRQNFFCRLQPDMLFLQTNEFYRRQTVMKGFFNWNISFGIWSLRPPFCLLFHLASRSCGKILTLYGEEGTVDNMAANWQHDRHL